MLLIDAREDNDPAPCPASVMPGLDNKELHYPMTPTSIFLFFVFSFTPRSRISLGSCPLLSPLRAPRNPGTTSPGRLPELSPDCTCALSCPPEESSLAVFILLGTESSVDAQRVPGCPRPRPGPAWQGSAGWVVVQGKLEVLGASLPRAGLVGKGPGSDEVGVGRELRE